MVPVDCLNLKLGLLRCNLHAGKCTFFGVDFYEFWQKCVLCNHHNQGVKNIPRPPPNSLGPRDAQLPSPTPQALAITDWFTASKVLSLFQKVVLMKQYIAFWVWLLLLSECIRDAPTSAYTRWLVLCFCWTLLHCVHVPRLVYPFTVAGHLGCFPGLGDHESSHCKYLHTDFYMGNEFHLPLGQSCVPFSQPPKLLPWLLHACLHNPQSPSLEGLSTSHFK